MALSKMQNFSFTHIDQPDRPQESASTRKQQWDSRGNELRAFINNLVDILNSPDGASNITATPISSLEGDNVQALIESLRNKLKGVTEGASGADFVKSSGIEGLTGSTVQELLKALKAYADTMQPKDELQSKLSMTKGAISSISGIDNAKGDVQIKAGTGITVNPNPESKTITITATGESIPGAHAAEHGMYGSDPITPALIGAAGASQLSNLAGVGRTTETVKENADNIASLQDEVIAHKAENTTQVNGAHGIRVQNNKLEYWDGTEWKRVSGGAEVPLGNVIGFKAKVDDGRVTLTWDDPADVTLEGIVISKWVGTKILRKIGSFPQNENDGVLVVNNGVRGQYATDGFVDAGLQNGETYYYMAFPYNTDGLYTVSKDNRLTATPTEQRIYGIRVDKNNSNPETRVTYIGDAVGFTPMRGNNGSFQWGSWQQVFNEFEIKPVVLQNKQVNYYLNPNDFTKKADGSSSVITGADGDVMIEFGRTLWTKWTDEGATYTIEVSDKPFAGAVKYAFEVEEGYNLVPYYPLFLTQQIYNILFKSTDSQTALGRGYVDGNTSYTSTGNTNKKGMFYGETTGKQQMKFLGMEDYWGNKYWWIDGLVTDASRNILIGKNGFNDTGAGYASYPSGLLVDTDGYVSEVQGGNEKGFIIKAKDGSESTYYADYGHLYSGRVVDFGGHRSIGSIAGFAALRLAHAASGSGATIGARLFCAANGKIYIGAYLGTVTGGKLRSISGTSEPTGSKTIGAFRTDAKANN